MLNRSCTTYFPNPNTSFSSMTMNPNNLEVMGNPSPNTSINEVDIFNTNVHELLSLTNDPGFSDHQPPQFQFPSFFTNEIPNSSLNYESIADFFSPDEGSNMGDNGLVHDYGNCFQNSSSQTAPYGVVANNQGYGGKKRKRNKEREAEKPREVVHVRAKRGQATDSHSLAERSRREKINEKLRCLQDLVPGCYKTMGMAVMLDVITNYVRSLQNQIDFLSMKLSAASLFYDFNSSDMATVEQCREKEYVYEAQAVEKVMGGGGGYVMQPQFYNSMPY